MSYRKQFAKAFARGSRANYRSQRDILRQLPVGEVVEDTDAVEEILRHLDNVEVRVARPSGRTLSSELGEDSELPEN